jgi:hypothetical protein
MGRFFSCFGCFHPTASLMPLICDRMPRFETSLLALINFFARKIQGSKIMQIALKAGAKLQFALSFEVLQTVHGSENSIFLRKTPIGPDGTMSACSSASGWPVPVLVRMGSSSPSEFGKQHY